jgi:threonine synthase
VVRAFEAGADRTEPWDDARTIASGIRVPVVLGDRLILDALRQSDGFAIAVEDEAIEAAQAAVARDEGVLLCPEGAATVAAWHQAVAAGRIGRDADAVLFNCASGLKYPMPASHRQLDRHRPIDFTAMGSRA